MLNAAEKRAMQMLSYRIARFMDDYDPYGFMDALEAGESINDGIERAARDKGFLEIGPRGKRTP